MSTLVVRPSSILETGGNTSPATPATVLSYLSDNSDATVVTNPGTGLAQYAFRLGSPTIPAGDFVARVGWSMRWKGNSSGNYSIGLLVYTSANSPGYYSSLTPNNSSAFTTTQVGYIAKEWTLSEVQSLNLSWFDGRSNAAWGVTEHADIWASLYTLTPATATPSNRTETSSVFPTITVAANAVIDWEASSQDWQNLRKVTVEVRIEQGGSSVGTGTLKSLSSGSTLFTATGSRNIVLNMPDALPNGTYKIYARALRYREDGIARADQYGTWSAGATLTMSAPLPATPTISTTTNQSQSHNTITVTPIASTGYSGPYIYIERSDDAGITWAPVRGAAGIIGSYGIPSSFDDYEAVRGQAALYRAQIQATYGGFLNASLYSASASATVNADGWNLKAVGNPAANMIGMNVVGKPTDQIEEDLGVFRPLGRTYPVVVSGTMSGWDGELLVTCSTSSEWAKLQTLIQLQAILYLESAFGESKYVRLLSPTKREASGTISTPIRRIGLTYVEVQKPAVIVGQSQINYEIPDLVDGGIASSTYNDFYDGGFAGSVMAPTFDGGGA